MNGVLKRFGLPLLLAAGAGWLAFSAPFMGDYRVEALPAVHALLGGDLHGFLSQAPPYGGSFLPRIPFMALAHGLGGGDLAVYRAGAFACLLAAAALAWALLSSLAPAQRVAGAGLGVVALCLGAPVLLRVLSSGHPEEALGGVLCVAAVLLALRDRPVWSGLALGLAVATKQWALIAGLPVLVAAPRRRGALLLAAAGAAAAVELPFLLADTGHYAAVSKGTTDTGRLFHPQQVWWPLRHAHTILERFSDGTARQLVVYTGTSWVSRISHPLIVALAAPLTALHLVRRRRTRGPAHDALLLLALLLFLRCLLDPWNVSYYVVPALFALTAWEARPGRIPAFALFVAAATYLSFVVAPRHLGGDAVAACYLAWAVPAAVGMAARLYAPAAVDRLLAPLRRSLGREAAQAMSSATAPRTSSAGA